MKKSRCEKSHVKEIRTLLKVLYWRMLPMIRPSLGAHQGALGDPHRGSPCAHLRGPDWGLVWTFARNIPLPLSHVGPPLLLTLLVIFSYLR